MRVGVDGGCWSNRRGYGRFLRELLGALTRTDRENEYVVFLDPPSYEDFRLGPPFRPVRVEVSEPVAKAASADGRRSIGDLLRMSRAASREPLDLFFFPSVYSYFPILRKLPILLAIHDSIPERNPSMHFDSRKAALFWRTKVRLALAQATLVLTVSEYSKRSLGKFLGVPGRNIRVLPEGASAVFRKLDAGAPEHRYVLYVGGFSPHKNLATLVRAFSQLQARFSGVRLVLVGDYQSDPFKHSYSDLKRLVSQLSLDKEVVFTGYVPDDELCRIYNQAALVALPSLDEGFGLPALEAMSCGVPVVASSGNAMEELIGDAGMLVDPHDEPAITAAMDRILADAALAQELSARSLQRASQFSWESTARGLVSVFHEMTLRFK